MNSMLDGNSLEVDESQPALSLGQNIEPQVVAEWSKSCVHEECTLHQLSPYIGKLKSSIAKDLIERFSKPGDLVVDPFAGSFTIPLEASLLGRRAIGADVSPYAYLLGRAKLSPPSSLQEALLRGELLLQQCEERPDPDLRKVPAWVRAFFHPKTLKEAIKFSDLCKQTEDYFLLACLLGILHHQRPGFLSYPSSHLVPYLRDKKFPREKFPEMYEYRPLKPRLLKKIERVYKRFSGFGGGKGRAVLATLDDFKFPNRAACVITSPPYMNALDYGRDNRLRLWFVDHAQMAHVDTAGSKQREGFEALMVHLAQRASKSLVVGGHCIIIIGEQSSRGYKGSPSSTVLDIFAHEAPNLVLIETMIDNIPDIRRARRHCKGVRAEHFLIFRKAINAL